MKFTTVSRVSAVFFAATAMLSMPALAQDSDLTTLEERVGYSIGINIGGNLVNQGVAEQIDVNALIMGISDTMTGSELQLTDEEINIAIQEFTAIQEARVAAELAAQESAMQNFLSENALNAGVVTTASGLQYEILEAAADSNAAMPSISDSVNVHYHGTMIDGTVFDSSVERGAPISFALNGVIAGWTEGLQLMRVGDKFRFFIPSDLAYGPAGAGPIGPNATLIFDVELLGIE